MVIRGTVLGIWLGLLKPSLPPAAAAAVAVPSSSLRAAAEVNAYQGPSQVPARAFVMGIKKGLVAA